MLFLGGNAKKVLFRRYTRWKNWMQKKNHAFGNESVSVRPLFIISIVSYSECQQSACVGFSAGQSAVYIKSAKENIVTVFHSVKVARLGVFLNPPQMRTIE